MASAKAVVSVWVGLVFQLWLNTVFQWGAQTLGYPGISSHLATLNRLIADELMPLYNRWAYDYILSEVMVKNHRICGRNLAGYVRGILRKGCPKSPPGHATPAPPIAIPVGCPDRDAANIVKYKNMACTDIDQIVPEVLKDYPSVGAAIQKVKDASQATLNKMSDISLFMYRNIERPICQPVGCRKIKIKAKALQPPVSLIIK